MVSQSPTSTTKSDRKSRATNAIIACWLTCIVSILAILSPSSGGYGFISWSWHPLLLIVGIYGLMPIGLLAYTLGTGSREASRFKHGLIMAGGGVCMYLGYAVAWYIHESKAHRHLPLLPPAQPLIKSLHIYGGLLVLVAVAAQALMGTLKARRLVESGERIFTWHGAAGPWVWAASAGIASTGVYMPFIQKGGGTIVGGLLIAASAAAVAFVFAAL